MKITILQGAFLPIPPALGGAIEKAWFAMGNYFAEQGHSVTHISRQFKDIPSHEKINDVYHVRVPSYEAPSNSLHYKLLDLFYSLRAVKQIPNSDIIITHTFWSPILLKWKKKGAVYVHVGRYPKGQMKFYQNAARLQAPSNAIADAIRSEVPAMSSKISSIPYPITLPKYVRDFENRSNTILYCGRIHKEKGIHLLVNAIQVLPESIRNQWTVKIVGAWKTEQGGSGEEYKTELINASKNLPVEIIDPIFDADKLNKTYQDAKIFVYPSLADKGETFGLAPLEAMSNGCIPVVSALGCFDDFISDRKNGFRFNHHASDAIQSLSKTLKILIESSENEQITYHKKAIKTANSFSLDTVARQYLEDFEKISAATK